ncbi:hypothetical protein SDC9_207927 [bioreactor metagenome]|uniref:Uncharacterized protein n=1 Tax=bioreactor metagenome TaxID=1076179 RepID=A0A645JAQ9_9ZZZZ
MIEFTKGLGDGFIATRVHGEAFPLPIAGSPQLFELLHDGSAILPLPFPSAFQKGLPADIPFINAFFGHLLHNFYLGRDGGMVRTR